MIPAAIFVGVIFMVFGGLGIVLAVLGVIASIVMSIVTTAITVGAFVVQFIINPRKAIRMWKDTAPCS